MKLGETATVVLNHKKALDLNPANANTVEMLANLGETWPPDEEMADPAILGTCMGGYQLAPSVILSLIISVTHEGGPSKVQVTG